MLQSLHYLCSPLLMCPFVPCTEEFWTGHSTLVVASPRAEKRGRITFLGVVGNTPLNVAQDTTGLFCHMVSCSTWYPPGCFGPFPQSGFPFGWPPAYTGSWGVTPHMQDVAPTLTEPHDIPTRLFLQLAEVQLDGSMILWYISYFIPFCVIRKVVEHMIWPIVQFINEDVKQDYTQYWPLEYTTNNWALITFCVADHHHHLSLVIQTVFGLIIQPTHWHLLSEDLMEAASKDLLTSK